MWVLYALYSPKIYSVKSLIQIEQPTSNMSSYENILIGGGQTIYLDEQIELYLSRSNMQRLIKEQNLNVVFNENDNFPEILEYLNLDNIVSIESGEVLIIRLDKEAFSILNSNEKLLSENKPYEKELTQELSKKIESNNELSITFYHPNDIVESIRSNLSIRKLATSRYLLNGSLLEISSLSSSPEQTIDIINEANNIFIEQSIFFNSEEAKQSLDYIESQLIVIQTNLDENIDRLNQFQEENISFDFELEAKAIIEQIGLIEGQQAELELQKAEYSGIYNDTNPLLQTVENKLLVLDSQKSVLNSKIADLPSAQQEYLRLYRDVELNQDLLKALLNSKLELSLKEASTLGNVKVIDSAYKYEQVSPKVGISLIISIFSGLFFGALFILLRSYFFEKISLPGQLKDEMPSSNVLGVIPNFKEGLHLDEIVNSITTNISILLDKKQNGRRSKNIVITGALAGAGKTSSSILLAKNLSERNKKVILVDCDYKRGDIHKSFEKETISEHELIDTSNIEKYKISEFLYVIPRPSKTATKSLSVFESEGFKHLIQHLETSFDYIIIDTPPALAASDALLLSSYSDILIGIIRHNQTTVSQLKELINSFNTVGKRFDNFIYNDFMKSFGYYYYDDEYSYKYRYYGYEQE
tara:strand:+ start:19085 stop:21013 length:1929 start_codon:yes stop_codon:yes gene_type:complete